MEGWKLEGVDWVGWVWEVGQGWDTDGESNKKRLLDGGAFEDQGETIMIYSLIY